MATSPRVALEYNLVDELLTHDEFEARVADIAGRQANGELNTVGYKAYVAEKGLGASPFPDLSGNIALIVGDGAIVSSNTGFGGIVAEDFRQQVRKARADKNIKAIVVRVNSPGGNVYASEVIRQELELAQIAGKPVVVSMGDIAASGGYWIASTADAIFAEPDTLTGSIGVFSLLTTFEDTLAEAGVTSDGIGTTPLSGGIGLASGVQPAMARILQASVDHSYQRFTHLVARGRTLEPDAVAQIAQGQIWVGERAQAVGLVDEIGGLDAAIARAAQLADVDEPRTRTFSEPPDPRALLMQELMSSSIVRDVVGSTSVAHTDLQSLITRAGAELGWLFGVSDPRGVYAVCTACEPFTARARLLRGRL